MKLFNPITNMFNYLLLYISIFSEVHYLYTTSSQFASVHHFDYDSVVLWCSPIMDSSTLYTLRTLPRDRLDGVLCLHLPNAWNVGNPATPDQYFAFGTIWVDEEGATVEGTSQRAHADVLRSRLSIGSIYRISKFGFQLPRRSYRCSTFERMLSLSLTMLFQLVTDPQPNFIVEAFEFVRFADLFSRVYPCAYLTGIFCLCFRHL
ncbi:hypothetical protein LINGRAHAP2_LOCUS34926 [Linum grandiflorum]